MLIFLAFSVALVSAVPAEIVVDVAAVHCLNAKPEHVDPQLFAALIELEIEHGVPDSLRGIVLATGCFEAGYDPKAHNKAEDARGLTQLRHWHRGTEHCRGLNEWDALDNALCWVRRLRHLAQGKALRRCGARRAWVAAEAWISQGQDSKAWPRPYYCDARSGHVDTLDRWRRIWRKRAL